MGADHLVSIFAGDSQIGVIDRLDGKVGVDYHDALLVLLDEKIADRLFKNDFLFAGPEVLIHHEHFPEQAADIVLHDSNTGGTALNKLGENIPIVGQFDDTVQLLQREEILDIGRREYSHLLRHTKSFGLAVDIAYTDDFERQTRQVSQADQFQQECTGSAAADNGHFQCGVPGKPLVHRPCPWASDKGAGAMPTHRVTVWVVGICLFYFHWVVNVKQSRLFPGKPHLDVFSFLPGSGIVAQPNGVMIIPFHVVFQGPGKRIN
jgi:hypothetical protein